MSDVRNDLSLNEIQSAANAVAEMARFTAFQAGASITYAKDGNLITESNDGTLVTIGHTKVAWIVPKKRRWNLR